MYLMICHRAYQDREHSSITLYLRVRWNESDPENSIKEIKGRGFSVDDFFHQVIGLSRNETKQNMSMDRDDMQQMADFLNVNVVVFASAEKCDKLAHLFTCMPN